MGAMVRRIARHISVVVGSIALVAACSGASATGAPVAAGGNLCKLLGPGDFAAAGISGAGGPSENNSPPAYFCVYRGQSSATGGIEFDAWTSDTVAEAHDGFLDLFGEFDPSDDTTVPIPGADEASLSLPSSVSSTDPALIGVRKGTLTFGIGVGVPFADAAKTGESLRDLAALVVQRAAAVGG
jgi:hypothetical protein